MMINLTEELGRAPAAIKYFNFSIFFREFPLRQVDTVICIEMAVT